jgi:serine/threonine protein kinase
MKHPLVLGLRAQIPGRTPSLVTEHPRNGSIASLLTADDQRRWRSPNRIAKVIAGIALAIGFAHSRGTIHRDLGPENILLDWDWTVQIADFGASASLDAPPLIRPDRPKHWPAGDSRHLAPERYDGPFRCASDVFPSLNRWQIAFTVAVADARPEIPESVPAAARALIEDC